MPLEELREMLRDVLARHGQEIVERGTDWVIEQSLDLRGARPRDETRRLVASVAEFSQELLLGEATGEQKRDAFVDFVTTYRASLTFNISTLLRGFLSFKEGISQVLEEGAIAPEIRLSILRMVDEVYFSTVFQMSDIYVDKLKAVIEERQEQLRERELQVTRLERSMAESLLKRFLAPSIVDEIISGHRSIDQKPRSMHATVMFADLVGFTRLSQTLDSQRLAELLNDYLATMSEVVFFHHGTIDKFIGDTLMALFGAPMPMSKEEQILFSVRCAVDMQRALLELDENPVSRGLPPLAMRIGIDCGMVVVGSFGSSYRSDFTAVGLQVNRARRVQTLCNPGEIFVTSDVAQYLPSEAVEPVGSFQLKGMSGGVLCYRVLPGRVS